MPDAIISIEKLGKRYSLRHQRERYTALRDVLAERAKRLFRRNGVGTRASKEDFWALKNISFEVKQGEVVGIIGRNGAGKSTLLKILSRITEPTEGRVKIKGRVASLLEVGTGFHPELTGRENIFLNGAILGMTRHEIRKKFDEIVAFAETEKFLDTPVKRYSSGMYVRLAFAVAAHLEPEILVVDEVLAVGDAQFQKKCLGKMDQVAKAGRTVLFVSHNMAVIQRLCSIAMLLQEGHLALMGGIKHAIGEYLRSFDQIAATGGTLKDHPRSPEMQNTIVGGTINGVPITSAHVVQPRSQLEIKLTLSLAHAMNYCTAGIHFETETGHIVMSVNTRWFLGPVTLSRGFHSILATIRTMPLVAGRYYLTLGFSSNGKQIDWLERVSYVDVQALDVYQTGHLPYEGQGYFLPDADVRVEAQEMVSSAR